MSAVLTNATSYLHYVIEGEGFHTKGHKLPQAKLKNQFESNRSEQQAQSIL
uniref:Uncharacterized protein n=1 Tax=Arundo donax TaxID=35708 RepID=A0A0A9FUW7_ARUDO